jgi:XRE family aerobic/anaerobic benzoate catabolism transcriptional regulator
MSNTLDARATADLSGRADAAFAGEVGRMVRLGRAKRGMSRRQLAQESGTSERYLAQIESGAGNPSVLVMRAIADALEMPMFELLPQTGGVAAPYARIIDLLGRVPPSDLAAIAETIERQIAPKSAPKSAADRGRRIGLVGLRGAGKSTLGKMLAKKIGWKFVELNKEIEAQNGLSVAEIIALYGQEGFRRMEQAALSQLLARKELMVLATGGGIVSEPLTFDLILSSFYTIWLKAEPEEHMARVRGQGDLRPMADDRSAMAELRNILVSREPLYARASAVVDTAGLSVDAAATRLIDAVAPVLHDKHVFGLRSAVS